MLHKQAGLSRSRMAIALQVLILATAAASLGGAGDPSHWSTTEASTRGPVSLEPVTTQTAAPSPANSTSAVDGPRTFIITSTNATAQTGDIVFLPCETPADMGTKLQVSWVRRKDWHILTSGQHAYTKEQRFAVHHPNGSNHWTLAIKYIKMADAGMYECQIVGGSTSMSQLVHLQVVTPRALIPGSGEHHVDAGSTISLECFIQQSTNPPQFIFWYHNSRMINYDRQRGGIKVKIETEPAVRSHLTVVDAREADSGNYTCDAANTEPASIAVYITQVNKIAAIQSRAVGSSSRVAVMAPSLIWLHLAMASTLLVQLVATTCGGRRLCWLGALGIRADGGT